MAHIDSLPRMRNMAGRMDYLRAVLRSCIPFAGIAIIGSLYSDRKFFWNLLLWPLAVVIPLITWTTIKIIRQVRNGEVIAIKSLFIYGLSLTFLAFVVFFSFVAEGIGSHGGYTGPFPLKLLFAFTTIFIVPVTDLFLYRYSQITHSQNNKTFKQTTALIRTIFVVFIIFSLLYMTHPPVNIALRQNYRSIAAVLIDSGFDINKKDGWGCLPLWYTVHRVDLDMTTILVNRGAKLNAAIAGFGVQRAIEDKNADMLRFLLNHGADANSKYMGAPPLLIACQRKDAAMIRILLDSGADINLKGEYPNMPYDGKSPLDIAYESGDRKIVELLLSHGKNH
jgi:ankyrin repeat protein